MKVLDNTMNDTNNIDEKSNDTLTRRELYKGVDFDLNTYQTKKDGKPLTVICEGFNSGHTLYEIDSFARDVEFTDSQAFKVTTNKNGAKQVELLSLAKYFHQVKSWQGAYFQHSPNSFFQKSNQLYEDFPTFTFSPYIAIVFESMVELNLMHGITLSRPSAILESGVTQAEVFNSLITRIHDKTKTVEFKKLVKSVENNYRRNKKSYERYFNALLERCARLLVLRLDFYFPKEQTGYITVEKAHEAREHFFNNMRANKLFADLVGLVWKLEWGNGGEYGDENKRGHHFHLIIFFDGIKRQQDAWIAEEIGKYWRTQIVPGGSFNNCNKAPNKYKKLGIGIINHDDVEKRENFLSEVLGYLTKQDQCLMVKPSKGRSIGRMEMPKARANAAGRPRKRPL